MSTERGREGSTKQQSSGPDSEFSTYWYHTKLEKGFQARDQKYLIISYPDLDTKGIRDFDIWD